MLTILLLSHNQEESGKLMAEARNTGYRKHVQELYVAGTWVCHGDYGATFSIATQ